MHRPSRLRCDVGDRTRRAILEGARLTKAGELGNEDQPGVTEYWPDYRNVDKQGWRFLCRRAAAWDESCWRAREVWSTATGAKSAALLRAMRPTRSWLRRVILNANSGHERAALAALLVGAWWAAPLVRLITPAAAEARDAGEDEEPTEVHGAATDENDDDEGDHSAVSTDNKDNDLDGGHDDDGGLADDGDAHLDGHATERGFGQATSASAASGAEGDGGDGSAEWSATNACCPACNATSSALDVHVICGAVHGEAPCGSISGRCTGAPATRAEFLRRTNELFELWSCSAWLASAPTGTHMQLATLLGGVRGLPPGLSDDIAAVFDETWGEWSHEQRVGGAR